MEERNVSILPRERHPGGSDEAYNQNSWLSWQETHSKEMAPPAKQTSMKKSLMDTYQGSLYAIAAHKGNPEPDCGHGVHHLLRSETAFTYPTTRTPRMPSSWDLGKLARKPSALFSSQMLSDATDGSLRDKLNALSASPRRCGRWGTVWLNLARGLAETGWYRPVCRSIAGPSEGGSTSAAGHRHAAAASS